MVTEGENSQREGGHRGGRSEKAVREGGHRRRWGHREGVSQRGEKVREVGQRGGVTEEGGSQGGGLNTVNYSELRNLNSFLSAAVHQILKYKLVQIMFDF